MIFSIASFLFLIVSKLYFPCTVIGSENIPKHGSCIFASNHKSNIDPCLIGVFSKRRPSFAAKESLFQNRLFAFVLKGLHAFPLRRTAADIRSLREALRRLQNGMPVVIFPQGTRVVTKAHSRVYPGLGFLAVKSKAPVIPVYIEGSDSVLPPGARFFRRNPIKIIFGASSQFSSTDPYEAISCTVMGDINKLAPSAS